jgi:protein-disulfide isomerase
LLDQVLDEFPGKVRLVVKDFPLRFHEGAVPAALAARCAGEHGRYWEYRELLFVAQPAFARRDLLLYAARLGLPRDAFQTCLDGARYRVAVRRDVEEGRAAGVSGTPTVFINGLRLVGVHPVEMLREAVQDALDDARGQRP